MARVLLFAIGILILIGAEMMKVYLIMPFPGSQQSESLEAAYFVHNYIWLFRIAGVALIAYPAFMFLRNEKIWVRWPVVVLLGFWIFVIYVFNFQFLADKMFVQPRQKSMVSVRDNKVSSKNLIVGVSLNGESKAYPIEVIGYHHHVNDTIGGEPVMVTYCTVCRTGRVYSPVVDGQAQEFRLVGMDQFNAMFEDRRTQSWWRQVNGEAVMGPMKGKMLNEVPSEQMSLGTWISFHPETLVMQPDSSFLDAYKGLEKYDEGKAKGSLERRDSLSWMEKSWVVGVQLGMESRAYDWVELQNKRVINDKLSGQSLIVVLENDSVTFHVWKRPDSLEFILDQGHDKLIDTKTRSTWDWSGRCIEGQLSGSRLEWIQSYQEYWHSWRTFRPQTTQFKDAGS